MAKAEIGSGFERRVWISSNNRFISLPTISTEYRELISAYEAASGTTLDSDVVHWWEVLGTLKWGIMCIGQAATHTTGAVRSHELAAIGRRVCENEHDLFLALEGRW